MSLDVFTTHIELSPYLKGDLPMLEELYTATDKFSQTEYPCGYVLEQNRLFLPRGTPISKLEFWSEQTANFDTDHDPVARMSRQHHSLYEPRNELQELSIHFLTTKDNPQLALNLQTGTGKTWVSCQAATMIGDRCLIITPNEGLKLQWINTFRKMFDYRDRDLRNISGSAVMEMIASDQLEPADVYFVNHQTLRSYLTQAGSEAFHDFFRKLKIGVKIYDESHLEFGNVLLIDSFSATARTWYLTATFDRSDKTESACFKRAFSSVEAFGEKESEKVVRKHVIYHVVNVSSRPTPQQMREVIRFNGMTAATYGRYAFLVDTNETAYLTILDILKKTTELEGKVMIFVPLIEAVDTVAKKLKVDYSDKSVGVYHSKISADEKESTLKKDIIVSTIKSCGTGKDIPGLRVVINCEPLASKVQAQQLIGRLRPYADGLDTYFFDVVDVSIPTINWWFRSRFKKILNLVKKVVYLDRTKG